MLVALKFNLTCSSEYEKLPNLMKTDPELDQLADTLKAIAAGAEWEYECGPTPISKWVTPVEGAESPMYGGASPLQAVRNGWPIRLKLKEEPVWRDLLPGEKMKPGDQYRVAGQHESWPWSEAQEYSSAEIQPNIEYRTTRPLPQKIPLTAADVPPGSVFRMPGSSEHCWMAPLEVYDCGLILHNDMRIAEYIRQPSWQRLMETGCEVKRLTDTEFQPCWKFSV